MGLPPVRPRRRHRAATARLPSHATLLTGTLTTLLRTQILFSELCKTFETHAAAAARAVPRPLQTRRSLPQAPSLPPPSPFDLLVGRTAAYTTACSTCRKSSRRRVKGGAVLLRQRSDEGEDVRLAHGPAVARRIVQRDECVQDSRSRSLRVGH